MTQDALKQEILTADDYTNPHHQQAFSRIARALVYDSARVKQGQRVLLWYEDDALPLMRLIHAIVEELTDKISYYKRDVQKDAEIVPSLNKRQIIDYFAEEKQLILDTDTSIIVRAPKDPEAIDRIPTNKRKLYMSAYSKVHEPRVSGKRGWTLFYYPIRYESKREKIPHDTYIEQIIKACDQPWDKIYKVQKKLVNLLNSAKTLRLVANPNDTDPKKRTDVTMSIDGMTFVNSTIDQNYPGSEVFSAPVKKSVNGNISAIGEYLYQGQLMKDLLFEVENGTIIKARAKKNNSGLQGILENGPGARHFGEVALGTNPGLTRRFFNALLNEKVGGSFHMAVGHCYTFTDYDGVAVNVNNGNTSEFTSNHWDITISMRPEAGGGAVYVDGKLIQKNGHFIDPDLAILNG